MVEIERPRIECVETPGDDSYGKYVVEPLERGYGTTLGNSLRRILLSSLPGTAVTTVKIAGIQHEFSTIPGVKEDVTEIILNIKQIIARLHSQRTKTIYIEASGEGEVTAGDIKPDGEVEILNPELHIATLSADASPVHRNDDRSRERLRFRGAQQAAAADHWCHPHRLHLYARAQGQLYG